MIGDQTLKCSVTVLYKSIVVKQISESIHFVSVETSVQWLSFYGGNRKDVKPTDIKIYIERSKTKDT